MFLLSWIYYLLYLLIIFASKKKKIWHIFFHCVQYRYMYRMKHVTGIVSIILQIMILMKNISYKNWMFSKGILF